MDNQKQTITIENVIDLSIDELRTINVPAELVMEIGVPVARVLHNLKVCQDTYRKAAAKETEAPKFELVGAEPQNAEENTEPEEGGEAYAKEEDQLESPIQE